MKYKVKFISMMLVFALLWMLMPLNMFAETLEKTELDFAEKITEIDNEENLQDECCSSELHDESTACTHNSNWTFDNETMTVSGVISIMPVFLLKDLLDDDGYHSAEVLQDGIPADQWSELEDGMTVQIFHNKELYGEYRVVDVIQASTSPKTTQTTLSAQGAPMRAMSNADTYGFTMPIDYMQVPRDVSSSFGSRYLYVGENKGDRIKLSDSNYPYVGTGKGDYIKDFHKGIDIGKNTFNDHMTQEERDNQSWDIRAVQGGQVVTASTGYNYGRGNYVVMRHDFPQAPVGMSKTIYTYYQHMANVAVETNDWIDRGHPLGQIGNTGDSSGDHLHFEIHLDENDTEESWKDPVAYLSGAPTYTHTHTYEYVWPEGTHPHVNYEQCTICGDLRSMGTNAATYEYTYYLTDHPHRQYGMCNMCHIEKFTGEHKPCNQVAIYADGDHPHRRYRKYACGANEYLDSYMECNQVAIYVSEDHPHRRYRVYACGATEWLDSFGECNQVAIYADGDHPHRRYRVYACGATEYLDSYMECKQVAIYTSETHPHRRYRVYACGADEWLDSYGTCTCK